MPGPGTIATFVLVATVLAVVPGPSNLYVVGQSLRGGRRQGYLAAAGCACAAMVYVGATALGVAALLASSATALSALHLIGGAYLIVLGIRALRSRPASDGPEPARVPGGRRVVSQGFLVELSNPKVALFFLAFFPQFIRPEQGPAWSQIVILGAILCLIGLLSDSIYATLAGTIRDRLGRRRSSGAVGARLSAAIYLGLGAWAIWSGARTETR